MERNSLIGWVVGIFLMSVASGSVLGDFETYFADMELFQQIIPGGLDPTAIIDQFLALIIGILSIFAIAPVLSVVLSLVKEEQLQRTEHFYSRSVARNTVLGSYLGLGLVASVLMQTGIGLGLYLSASQVMEDSLSLQTFLEASFVYLPAVWVMLGLTVLLVGWIPRGAKWIWGYVLLAFLILYIGNLLDFPDWLNNLSPFHHIPQLPYGEMEWPPIWALSGIALGSSIIGFIGYNKRDIQG